MAKKVSNASVGGADDALFVELGKSKKRKKRKILLTVVIILLVLGIAAVCGVTILQKRVRDQFASTGGEVLSHEVTTGSISTVVSGSGSLTDVDMETVTVPTGVEITEVMVKANDTVAQGDLLATVDMASVMSVMAELQAEIEALDEEISNAEDDEAADVIYAGVSGRVKAIYVGEDDGVAQVMYEKGALALLSLDGYMALDVETDALSAGDKVTVRLSAGEKYSGTVEAVSGGVATVLISDNGPKLDDTATLLDGDGKDLGSAALYIHSALRVTGYAGTVEEVLVKENKKVSATTKLFQLEDTDYSANYTTLLRTRSEKEESLLALLTIKRDGALLAPFAGSVYSLDESETEEGYSVVTLSRDEKMSVTISVDESDILSLALGQEVTVTVSSVGEDGFVGTLTEINRTSSSSGSYSAVVELDKTQGMLSGMTASVSVKIEGVEDAILIPIEALHETSNGAYVYTSYDEELQEYGGKVDVVTGLENSTYVEIKSGLSVGDTVYYTEEETGFAGFGNKPGGSGGMPSFGSEGGMPDFSGGMPNFGGGSGGGMSDFGGGSGGFPGRN